ncbi:hypothetical protein HYV82_00155 [Candidatus Woesearchaeota archaeon]|nr:hypothetical protein [Candidatus Woesearchaeota archaeon]
MSGPVLVTIAGIVREPDNCTFANVLAGNVHDQRYKIIVRTEDRKLIDGMYAAVRPVLAQDMPGMLNVDQLSELERVCKGACAGFQMPVALDNGRLPDDFPIRLYEAVWPEIEAAVMYNDVL